MRRATAAAAMEHQLETRCAAEALAEKGLDLTPAHDRLALEREEREQLLRQRDNVNANEASLPMQLAVVEARSDLSPTRPTGPLQRRPPGNRPLLKHARSPATFSAPPLRRTRSKCVARLLPPRWNTSS